MTKPAFVTIHIDGAARGNPGPAAYAYIIARDGQPPVAEAGCLGTATNNFAEYTACLRALERAQSVGAARLLILSDSDLLVKQMNGQYRVKNPDLQVLYRQAKKLCEDFDLVTIRHIPREQNAEADRMCNEALDAECRGTRARSGPTKSAANPARQDRCRASAIACLQAAALEWSKGDAASPRPDQVWEQLWSILEEEGIVRPAGKAGAIRKS